MTTRTKTGDSAGPWGVAQPLLVERSQALLAAIQSCCNSVDDPDHIHDLRVASRRLESALKSFASLLPTNQRRRLKKQVRSIRRAAGQLRDLDVLLLQLTKSPVDSGEEVVISALREERQLLAQDLTRRLSHEEQERLRRRLQDIAGSGCNGSYESTTGLSEWAAAQVQPTSSRFLDAAQGDLLKTKDLHQLRLRGKQLRYSLELFQTQLDRNRVSRALKALRDIQERLGDMNDHSSAHQLLSEVAALPPDETVRKIARRMARQEKRFLKRDRRRFLKWWHAGAARRIGKRIRHSMLDAAGAPVDS